MRALLLGVLLASVLTSSVAFADEPEPTPSPQAVQQRRSPTLVKIGAVSAAAGGIVFLSSLGPYLLPASSHGNSESEETRLEILMLASAPVMIVGVILAAYGDQRVPSAGSARVRGSPGGMALTF